jgi:two-component system copper resistance phosphate regulon response regulator CusR
MNGSHRSFMWARLSWTRSRGTDVRLLLVEDEPSAAQVLAGGLREHAYAVDVAADGEAAVFQAGTTDYDAVILDVMLPLKDGFAVCRAIRESGSPVPILMVTARDAVEARIEGLDSGADDYLVKPFDFRELLARLRALIRRGRGPLLPERLRLGPLTLETRSHRAWMRQRELALTAKEYALLEYLAHRAGDVVSRADIAEHVWDEHYDPLSNVVDVYVQRLRRKLDRPGAESLIRTRRGEGYQLAAEAEPP